MTNNNIYFVANWKMYGNLTSLNALNKVINISRSKFFKKAKFIYCPPFTLLDQFVKKTRNTKIEVGAQDCHFVNGSGPYTGMISANQIKKLLKFYCENSDFEKKSFDACFFEFNESCIQRHMKAAGIFARLLIKEKRNSHIKYIPRTINYIIEETNNTKFSLINKYSTLVRDKLNASNIISSW